MTEMNDTETIVLGGGCFWCVEACIGLIEGVVEVTPGYAGGFTVNPGYKEVCSGTTGHAEVVRVAFDPGRISLEDILDVFFTAHDPTTLNRQGADVGTQYRSVILTTSPGQKHRVEEYVEKIRADYTVPVVTEVAELGDFYPAEDHHRRYYDSNKRQPYCRMVIAPKVEKVKKKLG
jgi:methionine-S-sulfoxide reductase